MVRKETLVHILPGSLIRHKAEGSQCTAHSTVIDALMSPRLFPGLYPCVRVRRIICLDGLYPQAAAGQPVGHRAEIGRTAVLPGRSNSVTRKFFCTLHQQRTHGIIVDHADGFATLYAHCSSISAKVGDKVTCGEQIAKVGQTGNATGPHLHLELWHNGAALDPADYLTL